MELQHHLSAHHRALDLAGILYLVIDISSGKVVAWDVDEREDHPLRWIWLEGLV